MLRIIGVVFGLAVFASNADACPMADKAAFEAAAEVVVKTDGSKATFVLSGMSGGVCSEKVTSSLKGVDGILASAVDYQSGRVELAYDAKKTSLQKIESTLKDTGFTITSKPNG